MKPGELLIGLRELFAFVVPGMAFILLLPSVVQVYLAQQIAMALLPASETLALIIFFFAAYAIGASLSALGSMFDQQAERLIDAVRHRQRWQQAREQENALKEAAAELQRKALAHVPLKDPHKGWGDRAFWWTWLRIHCPACVAEVDRLEAQQKLFRSLMVATMVLIGMHGIVLAGVAVRVGFGFSPRAAGLKLVVEALPMLVALPPVGLACALQYAGLRRLLSRRLYQSAVLQFVPTTLGCSAPPDQPPERRQL